MFSVFERPTNSYFCHPDEKKNLKDGQCKKTCRVEHSQTFCIIFHGREERKQADHVSDTTYNPNIPPQEGSFVQTKHFGGIIKTIHVPHLSACVQQQYLEAVSTLIVLMKQDKANFKLVPCHRNGLLVCPFGHRT